MPKKARTAEENEVVEAVEAQAPTKKKKKAMKVATEEAAAAEPAVEETAAAEATTEKKKKKKKAAAAEEATTEAVTEEAPAVEEGEKKKKKKKKAAAEEEPAAEEAPAAEKSKKKKKKTTEEVAEEAEAEAEEKPAKKQKKEEEDESPSASTAVSEGKGADAAEEDAQSLSIFVGNISFKADMDQMKKDFEECGEMEDFNAPLNEEGRPKGIAFITYKTAEGLQKAMEYNGQDYYGRDLRVEKRENKPKGKGKDGKGKGKKGKNERGEKPENCLSVVVKGIGFSATEDDMWAVFADAKAIKLLTDRETGQSKGMAFVDFEETEKVDEAIKEHDGKEIGGRAIFVDYNVPREKGEKGKDGKGKGKKGKDGKGKGKGKKGKGKDADPIRAANQGSIQEFKGTVTAFNDSDSD